MIAGIYARASTMKQGDTIEHQVQMIHEYSKRLEIKVTFDEKFVYKDEGESGFKTTLLQRPSMKQLLEDIESGLVDIVFFKGISRFARNSGEAIQTANRLIQKGVRVISVEESYDSDVSDPTFFQMYAVLAEAESRKTSVRVSLGNKQKARNGLWTSSVAPMGYSKVKDLKDKELKEKLLGEGKHPHSLYPDPNNSDIIRKIFDLYVNQGFGRKKIVNWINSQGVKTAFGNVVRDITIKRMLMNPVYVGDIVYGKTRYQYIDSDDGLRKIQKVVDIDKEDWAICENAHPPLIEREVFMKAQRLIKQKEKAYNSGRRFNNAKHPLTGLLKCSLCGAPMICQKRTNKKKDGTKLEYRYYVCSTYHQKGRDVCPQANINADDLEHYIHQQLSKQILRVRDDKRLLENYKTYNPNKEINSQIKMIDKEIEKNTNKSLLLLENKEIYDDQTFRDINLKLKEETVKLRKQKDELMEELKFSEDILTKDDLKNKFDKFLNLNLSDIPEVRNTFHEWINEVRVDGKKVIIDQKFKMF
ncbi:recombinase family protein [Priestia megaterium]|uniref:recombinase family protein n=1 Tax=Priestia megaterium TaxID=1404 RepID=UPI00211C89E5|nr:recombinase family protein [Priestia megaterium]